MTMVCLFVWVREGDGGAEAEVSRWLLAAGAGLCGSAHLCLILHVSTGRTAAALIFSLLFSKPARYRNRIGATATLSTKEKFEGEGR